MQQRRLGNSSLFVSELGLGCMSLGENRGTAIQLIDSAVDAGVNFLDTADLYNKGLNEEIVGAAIKHRRHQIILATKVGNRFERDKPGWHWDPSKAYIMQEVKESLKRLQTDYIDLYQLHGGTIEDNIDETIEAFEQLQQEGVIRHYGISSIRPNVIREYVAKSNIVSVMMQYSLLDRRPEEKVLNLLAEHSISVIARGPLAQGMLANARNKPIPDKPYLGQSPEQLQDVVSKLQRFAALQHRSSTETALRFPLAHPRTASVVTGASSLTQVQENVQAINASPLTEAELAELRAITPALTYELHR